ncbi:MAG: hypothetical protein KDI56_04180 [Xanthomonadales bacterium]|nr:hypothetical protein [Xanthomonadales bacterium]
MQQLHRAGDRLVVAGQFVGTGRGAASRAASGLAVFALPVDPVVDAIFADGYE